MDLLELIDALEETIDRSASIPLSGKSLMDKDELLDLIEELRLKMPDDLKQAKWVKEERQRILHEAQKEASAIIKEAEDKLIPMINEHEISRRAEEHAQEIIAKAEARAQEIRKGVNQYSDDMLAGLQSVVEDAKKHFITARERFDQSLKTLDEVLDVLADNRKELEE